MAFVSLSTRDANVLEKIKDPESNPNAAPLIDSSIPRDPHITDTAVYEEIAAKERAIIQSIQKLEMELDQSQSIDCSEAALEGYRRCLSSLSGLILEHPNYASARNNRAQVLRRLYGDAMLLNISTGMPIPLVDEPEPPEKRQAAGTFLTDLEQSIKLLSPRTPSTPLSPQAARTLSMAHTQRAAIYLKTSKLLSYRQVDIDDDFTESTWLRIDFEEAASHDLALGGRYGNEIAKGLAVGVNPTAKLCGQMVREAMKKEYGETF